MQIGFIGAGKVGCSIGKYLKEHGRPVAGYVSRHIESSEFAGTFTDTKAFENLQEMTENCDILCITTTDREIGNVWNELQKQDLVAHIHLRFFKESTKKRHLPARFILCVRSATNPQVTDN